MASICALSFGLGAGISWLIQRKCSKHALKETNPGRREPGLVTYVHPPHPAWEPRQPQPHPVPSDDRIEVDPGEIDKAYLYSLMISAVTPRPIGFVSSMGSDGSHNLSPYSYFNMVGRYCIYFAWDPTTPIWVRHKPLVFHHQLSHNPPIVALGCCRHGGRPPVDGEPAKKDTLANIEETG